MSTIEMPAFTDVKACKCPQCSGMCEARPAFLQATRTRPMQFLGWQGYCKGECFHPFSGAFVFRTDAVQEAMPV